MADKIKPLSSEERKERLRLSALARRMQIINSPAGFDHVINDPEYSQIEKDYILFHMNDLESISKLTLLEFRKRVSAFEIENNQEVNDV